MIEEMIIAMSYLQFNTNVEEAGHKIFSFIRNSMMENMAQDFL